MKYQPSFEAAVSNCSLHATLLLVSKALTLSGFGEVEVLDRRTSRQKSRLGGCELMCRTSMGHVQLKIIVKVLTDSLRQRLFDELAGSSDRLRSDFGILVSTRNLSSKFASATALYQRAHLEVIDLAKLCHLLAKFKIGIRANGEPDYAYFAELEVQADRVDQFLRFEREFR